MLQKDHINTILLFFRRKYHLILLAHSLSFSLQSTFCKIKFIFCSSLCIKLRMQYKCWNVERIDNTPWRIAPSMPISILRNDHALISQACISNPNLVKVFTYFVKWKKDCPRYTWCFPVLLTLLWMLCFELDSYCLSFLSGVGHPFLFDYFLWILFFSCFCAYVSASYPLVWTIVTVSRVVHLNF